MKVLKLLFGIIYFSLSGITLYSAQAAQTAQTAQKKLTLRIFNLIAQESSFSVDGPSFKETVGTGEIVEKVITITPETDTKVNLRPVSTNFNAKGILVVINLSASGTLTAKAKEFNRPKILRKIDTSSDVLELYIAMLPRTGSLALVAETRGKDAIQAFRNSIAKHETPKDPVMASLMKSVKKYDESQSKLKTLTTELEGMMTEALEREQERRIKAEELKLKQQRKEMREKIEAEKLNKERLAREELARAREKAAEEKQEKIRHEQNFSDGTYETLSASLPPLSPSSPKSPLSTELPSPKAIPSYGQPYDFDIIESLQKFIIETTKISKATVVNRQRVPHLYCPEFMQRCSQEDERGLFEELWEKTGIKTEPTIAKATAFAKAKRKIKQ